MPQIQLERLHKSYHLNVRVFMTRVVHGAIDSAGPIEKNCCRFVIPGQVLDPRVPEVHRRDADCRRQSRGVEGGEYCSGGHPVEHRIARPSWGFALRSQIRVVLMLVSNTELL